MGCRVRARASGHATVRVFVFAVDGHAREVQAGFCSALERGAERCETRSRRVTSAVVESRVPGGHGTAGRRDICKTFLIRAFTRLSLCKLSFHISHGLRWYTYTFTFLLWRVPRHVPRSNALESNFLYGFGYAARAIASRPVSTRPDSMPAASSRYPRGLPESLLTSR